MTGRPGPRRPAAAASPDRTLEQQLQAVLLVPLLTDLLEADPDSAPYLLHVLLDDPHLVGRIGCHEGPAHGVLEIGYYVSPAYRGHGVATDMVGRFLAWLAPRGVTRVRAAVSPDNAASRAVLAHFGFVEVGDQWDDEDGLELLYEVGLATGPPTGPPARGQPRPTGSEQANT